MRFIRNMSPRHLKSFILYVSLPMLSTGLFILKQLSNVIFLVLKAGKGFIQLFGVENLDN